MTAIESYSSGLKCNKPIDNLKHLNQVKYFFKSLQFLCFVLIQVTSIAQIKQIWALGDGEKVFRDDLNHPDKNKNFIWDGETIHLKGLYNEVLAFQVIVESGASEEKGIEVSIDGLLNKKSGKIIGGNTLKYGPQGTIEIYTEHYLHVTDSTLPNWFYGSPAAAPKKMTGWIPDALIPTDALRGRGGFPVDIAANSNQGFWIDLHLPRDRKNFPPGIYESTVLVQQQGKVIKEIPLKVILLPQYLPDDDHANVWLFTEKVHSYFPTLSKQEVDEMLKFEGHRHRVQVVGGFDANQSVFSNETMEKYKGYLDGSAYTPANGYHGTGEGVGEKIFPVGMYGSPVMGKTKDSVQQQANLWVDWFKTNSPATTYFWYITDEPDSTRYAWIKERSDWIKSNTAVGKSMPVFTTTTYNKGLAGAIDIWAGYNGVDLTELPAIRKNGNDHWFYNGNRPRYGSVILEGAAVDFRVNSWILYKYGINTWFIWNGTHWQHNMQGPKKHLHQNIFVNPLTFINDQMEYGNGDGIIFYPGHMPFYSEEDRGMNRILPSIRLKNIRRGQQDAAIMLMAEKKIGREKVLNIINKIVPKALSEVSMKDAVPWSQKGDDYDKVRDELLKLL
jgi:hypothetical protein